MQSGTNPNHVMLPRRFKVIRPYLAAQIHANHDRPPLSEVLHYLSKPGKEARASQYIEKVDERGDYRAITFKGFDSPFYYPKNCSWIDLCSTIDESFDPKNWHNYITQQTPIGDHDVVVDCGAAEGLFTFICSQKAAKVFVFEPHPKFVATLTENFSSCSRVAVYPHGVGHKEQTARITDNEIFSAISAEGPIQIEVKTLDGTLLSSGEPVTFLKADVEGFEFQVLLGAEELIAKYRPKISVTVYHQTNNVCQIEAFLKQLQPGYRFATKGISEHGGPVMLHAW